MSKRTFWIIMVCVMFLGVWATIGIVNSVFDDTPRAPSPWEVFSQTCIDKGGIPNPFGPDDRWNCDAVKDKSNETKEGE